MGFGLCTPCLAYSIDNMKINHEDLNKNLTFWLFLGPVFAL